MKILCTICARGKSKGLKNKNIKKINGLPLISHTINHAQKSKIFDEIVVSSDSKKILTIAKSLGARPLKRPNSLSSDNAGKLDAIKHALKSIEKIDGEKYDIIIDLDVTSPLRKISDIKNALNLFREKKASLVMSATVSRKNPYFNQVYQRRNSVKLVKIDKSNYKRRQDAPIIYDLNASIYVYKRNILIKSNTIFVNKSFLYLMPQNRSFDIDSKSDFDYVNFLMKKKDL